MGCNGGNVFFALMYVKGHPLMKWDDYTPYHAARGTCVYDESKGVGRVSGLKRMVLLDRATKEEKMKAAASQQPISIAIQAN